MRKITVTHDDGTQVTYDSELLKPEQVATLFAVDVKTVTRWAKAGKLTTVRTLGNHRRFSEAEVLALLNGSRQERQP